MGKKDLEQKISQGREYRNLSVPLCVREKVDGNDDDYVVEGYATTFNERYLLFEYKGWDNKLYRVFEVVDSKAFDSCDMGDVIMQYNHEGRVYARTRNKTLDITPDEHGLKVRANLSGTELGKQLFEEIKGGYTDKMSFGFTIEDEKRDSHEEDDVVTITRTITKIGKLYDVSAVSIPANDATEISARSFQDGFIKELESERAKVEKREALRLRIKIRSEGN